MCERQFEPMGTLPRAPIGCFLSAISERKTITGGALLNVSNEHLAFEKNV